MRRTLILGAGFGGLSVATELRERLGDRHEIVLLDQRDDLVLGLRKLWAVAGIGTLEEGRRNRRELTARGIPFRRCEILRIDPAQRRVETDDGTFEGDDLVVALGAVTRPDLVPGLAQHAHSLYDVDAIPALAAAVAALTRGTIAIVIAGAPYKCPPAPYECAMLLGEAFERRGLRAAVRIVVTTLSPILLPSAGVAGSEWLGERLRERGIEFAAGRRPVRIEERRVVYEEGAPLDAALVIVVAPHRVPAVVAESGLTAGGDWIPVDPGTMATSHEHVFAIGDVVQIRLANGLPLPKAGLMAESQGRCVAAAIAASVTGATAPEPFDGRGHCFVEMGASEAALLEGNFYARPEPDVRFVGASAAHADEKRRFESERLARWFGS